jgi:hypothetical protein
LRRLLFLLLLTYGQYCNAHLQLDFTKKYSSFAEADVEAEVGSMAEAEVEARSMAELAMEVFVASVGRVNVFDKEGLFGGAGALGAVVLGVEGAGLGKREKLTERLWPFPPMEKPSLPMAKLMPSLVESRVRSWQRRKKWQKMCNKPANVADV